MKFKVEMGLLSLAIALFVLGAFFYSYHTTNEGLAFNADLSTYPFRAYAIAFVGFGSLLTLAASVSYSRRSKNLEHKSYRV